MRRIKIIADSSANLTHMEGIDFASAPLKIIAGETEFVDNETPDAGVCAATMGKAAVCR